MKLILPILILLFLSACQSSNPVKLIYPDKIHQEINWSKEDLQKEIAIRHLHRSETASTHLIRVCS